MAISHRSNDDPDSREPQPNRSLRRTLLVAAKWIAAMIVFPILFGALVLVVLVNSTRGKAFLIHLIQRQAGESLGVPVRLQNLDVQLSALSVDLYGLTVDGAGPHSSPPLLQAQHVQAGVRIVSVFGREWYFDNIRIDNPVAQIFVDRNGVSNLPTFKRTDGGSNTTVFDLGIRHAVIANGAVFYNDQPSSLALDLRDVQFSAAFNSLLQKYSGTLAYSDGRIAYSGTQAPPHALTVQFDATPTALYLSRVTIQAGNTNVVIRATVNNYSAPDVHAQYEATIDGQELAGMLHNPSIPTGLVVVSGSAQYRSNAGHSLLQNLVVNGELSSRQLVARKPTLHAEIFNVAAHYSLANGDATLRDFRAMLLGGEITAQGTMENIGGDSQAKFNATLRGISLAKAEQMAGSAASTGPIGIGGALDATASATWGKTFDDLVAHADAVIHAGLANAKHATVAPQAVAPTAGAGASQASSIPVEGDLHATYTYKNQELAVEHSYVRTQQTNLNLDGTISKSSSIAIQFRANDLSEVGAIADLFRTPEPGQALRPLGLAGTASFNGIVRGSTSAPHLTGELIAQNLQLQGSSWKMVRTHVDASPSSVSLQHAELDPGAQGHLALNASAQLNDWSFSKASPAQLQLKASQLDISEIAKLAGYPIPATGTVTADIDMHGSVLNPEGDGTITLSHAAAYGEPISSAKVTFTGNGDQAHAKLSLSAPAGVVEAEVTASMNNRTYSAELTSGVHLDKLQRFKHSNMSSSGVVNISAKGQGTFDNPQLDADIQVPSLVVQQHTISAIRLHANIADHEATAQLTSSAINTVIKGNGKVALTGDYLADATLDTQGIPLGPFLAVYAPDEAANITGETELHATLHGPLNNKQQLEAHVTVPLLKLAYGNTVQLAATAPIHADYKNGVIEVQRSSIRGTDTDLQFQGTIPTADNARISLLLLGTVDLHLAQLFNPDLRTSGQLKFNINSYGAVNSADVAGTVDIVDASVTSPDLPIGLQHCNGTLGLVKNRINITQFKGNIGGGTLTAQGGITLRPSIRFDMGAAAHDVRLLYPQGMRTSINANLRLSGSPRAAVLGGTVNVADLSFTNAFDLNNFVNQLTGGVEAPPSQGLAQNITLDIALHSSNNLNLVSRTLSIGGSANLQVRGTVAEPVILGRANLTDGDIILNGDRYVLTGGTVQFVNPSVTEPVVNLTLTTSIQQYNISLRFNGPMDQLRTQFTSDPALPSADIIHLLAFGQTSESSTANATPANQAAKTLVANQVSSQVTSRISKVAGISQLSINPVLANGNSQSPAGANVTVQQRVTANLFVTFSSNITTVEGQTIQGQYQVSPRFAISGTSDPNGGFAIDALIKRSW